MSIIERVRLKLLEHVYDTKVHCDPRDSFERLIFSNQEFHLKVNSAHPTIAFIQISLLLVTNSPIAVYYGLELKETL